MEVSTVEINVETGVEIDIETGVESIFLSFVCVVVMASVWVWLLCGF